MTFVLLAMQKLIPIPSKVKATGADQLGIAILHVLLPNQSTKLFQLLFEFLAVFRRSPAYAVKNAGWNFVYGIAQPMCDPGDEPKPRAAVSGFLPDSCPQQPQYRRLFGRELLTALGAMQQVIRKAGQPTGAARKAILVAGKQRGKNRPLEQRPTDDKIQAVVYDLPGQRSRSRKPIGRRRVPKGIEEHLKGSQFVGARGAAFCCFVRLPELALIVGKHRNQRGLTNKLTRGGRC
jgi:hypothetical protein